MAGITDWYRNATRRWPKVAWSLEAFIRHVNGETPARPEDLFLAGAAGWRVAAAWETISNEFSPKVQQVLKRFPRADCTVEDLWADTLLRLIEDDDSAPKVDEIRHCAQIVRFRGQIPLLGYLVTIARRLAISRKRSSAFRRSTGAPAVDEVDTQTRQPCDVAHENETIGNLIRLFRQACLQLSDDQRFLVRMVYVQGLTQRQAGSMLNWSEFKTSRTLSAAMEILEQTIAQAHPGGWTPALSAAWTELVQNTLSPPQESPVQASEPVEKGAGV